MVAGRGTKSGAAQEWRFPSVDELLDQSVSDPAAAAIERSGAVALEPPAGWDLRIAWGAAPCMTAPTVQVTGAAAQIAAVAVDVKN